MPFTPAHAAAAWPLHRAYPRLPLAALAIGTTAPDLEYVLRMAPRGKFGHSPQGLVLFCLPATLILWWAWRSAIRPALTPLLPPRIRAAAEAPAPGRATDALPLAVVAALLGSVTHVLWDGFTHATGWVVEIFPVLATTPFASQPNLPWFSMLQYASSVVGMLLVAAWALRAWLRWPPDTRRFAPGQRARLAGAVLFVAAVALALGAFNSTFAVSPGIRLGRAAVGGIAGLGIGLALYAVWAASRGRVAVPS